MKLNNGRDAYQDLDSGTKKILYSLLESTSEAKETKRYLRQSEVNEDIKENIGASKKIRPSDILKSRGLFYLFELQNLGIISFPYEDPKDWIVFRNIFYLVCEFFDDMLAIKRKRGRPVSEGMKLVRLLAILVKRRDDYYHLGLGVDAYEHILLEALQVRLDLSDDWKVLHTVYEKEKFLMVEFRAARTAVDRFWTIEYGKAPPAIDKKTSQIFVEYFIDKKNKRANKVKK